MPRGRRLDYEGAHQHVINRGARRAHIFAVPGARQLFLELLSELPARFGITIHAYAIMGNHYHLMARTPEGGLARVIKRLDQTFTQRLNHQMDWDGPVFRGRYHNVLVGNRFHWNYLLAYIHGNPVRAGLPTKLHDPLWTSHGAYLSHGDTARWLEVETHLRRLGGVEGYCRWLGERVDGELNAPEGFAPERRGASTGTELRPARRSRELMDLLAQLDFALCEDWRHKPERPDVRIAAWWLRLNEVPFQRVGALLDVSRSTVCRWTDQVVELSQDDRTVASTMAALAGETPRGRLRLAS